MVDGGPSAGTVLDLCVHADGSVEWRFVAGPAQGRIGRSRTFAHQPARDQIIAVWLPLGADAVSATVDLAAGRFTGFMIEDGRAIPVSGVIYAL